MTTALVLAGGSFLGRHLCRGLRERGVRVVATGRNPDAAYCDITDLKSVQIVTAGCRPDWIFSCAGATAPGAAAAEMHRVHVGGALNVLRAASEAAPAAVIVLPGSAAEYGPVEAGALPVREDHPARPASFFGLSKLAQTHIARAAAAEWNLRVLVARPFNLLGPGLPPHYLAAALARRLLREGAAARPLPVANADATRDFVDVRDAADALIALAERAAPPPGVARVFNVAAGRETSVLTLAQTLCDLHGGCRAVAGEASASRSRVVRSCGDASRLRRVTGWAPHLGWRQSLHDLWTACVADEPRALAG